MDQPQVESQPLVCPSHTTHYIVVAIIGMLIGGALTCAYFRYAPVDGSKTYQAGFDAAKKLVEQSNIGPMLQAAQDVRTLNGSVTKVEGNRITLHVVSMNPFEDPALLDRTIVVTSDTKITKLSQKDPQVFQTEMNAFMKNTQKAGATLQTPPAPFAQSSATVADIAVGDSLNVTAAENIKTMKEFSASEISIQPNMAIPTTTSAPIPLPAVAPTN